MIAGFESLKRSIITELPLRKIAAYIPINGVINEPILMAVSHEETSGATEDTGTRSQTTGRQRMARESQSVGIDCLALYSLP